MADQRITQFTVKSSLSSTDLIPIVDLDGIAENKAILGSVLSTDISQTAAEVAAGLTPVAPQYEVGNALRYGLVPNQVTSRSANTAFLQAALSPTTSAFVGEFYFPNTTGTDVYYFDSRIPCRDNINIDLMGCTLDFAKTGEATDTDGGAIHFLRDCSIGNGSIVVNYTQVTGTNTFNAIMMGGRNTSSADFGLLRDALQPAPFGNIRIHDLSIDYTGGTNSNAILGFGGLKNVIIENVTINGNGTLKGGIVYEFGFATDEALAVDRESSHCSNVQIRNCGIYDVDDTGGVLGAAVRFGGANTAIIDGLDIRGAFFGVVFSPGEALFYNPWNPGNEMFRPRVDIRNVNFSEIQSIGLSLSGASENIGYLSTVSIPDENLVDLQEFVVDGFSALGGTNGTSLTAAVAGSGGKISVSNGSITNAVNGFRYDDNTVDFTIDNVHVLDCTSIALRLNFTGGVFATERMKNCRISNCVIAGNEGVACTIDHADNATFENNRFGYTVAQDGVAETTQDGAIQVGANATVYAIRNNVAAVTAGNAYTGISGGFGALIDPIGDRSSSVHWRSQGRSIGTQGDGNLTVTAGVDEEVQVFDTTLTGNRTVTLSTTGAVHGDRFRIVREDTAAFTIDVGGLRTIPSATAAFVDVEFDTAWRLTGYGEL